MNNLAMLVTLIALVAGQWVAIIGLYIWSFKGFSKIYDNINEHKQESEIHVKGEEKFVQILTCNIVHKAVKEDLHELKIDVKELLTR